MCSLGRGLYGLIKQEVGFYSVQFQKERSCCFQEEVKNERKPISVVHPSDSVALKIKI